MCFYLYSIPSCFLSTYYFFLFLYNEYTLTGAQFYESLLVHRVVRYYGSQDTEHSVIPLTCSWSHPFSQSPRLVTNDILSSPVIESIPDHKYIYRFLSLASFTYQIILEIHPYDVCQLFICFESLKSISLYYIIIHYIISLY